MADMDIKIKGYSDINWPALRCTSDISSCLSINGASKKPKRFNQQS
jgi:hypothetical protein